LAHHLIDLKSKYMVVKGELTEVKVDELKNDPVIASVKKLYKNDLDVSEFSITNEILVKLKTNVSEGQILNLIADLTPEVNKRNSFGQKTLLLKIKTLNEQNVFKAANKIFESGLVEFAHPNFITFDWIETNDTYYSNQWNLAKISAVAAWNISTGSSSIKIAILDCGVESDHDDLQNNIVSGRDVVDDDYTTEPYGDYFHGTACAGIASAATNNNKGIAGVAYNCSIMPIQISHTTNFMIANDVADGITWAYSNGADVINFSGKTTSADAVYNAINSAVQNGRNGKGCVFVKSSGNDNGSITYPGEHEKVICVGATDSNDNRRNYSNYGTALDVMAPTDVYGTDLSGSAGENTAINGDYFNNFWGTSFSAPHVSGLAALMISNNSSLAEAQIRDIICKTADDLGDAGFDIYFGWGRINAYRALLATETPTTSGTLSGDEVWYGNIVLTDNVIVPSNVELQILRGATISIPAGKKIQVYGTLKAVGIASDRITFDRSGASNWYGIKFESTGDGELDYCTIQNASFAVYANQSSPKVQNCIFNSNVYHFNVSYGMGSVFDVFENNTLNNSSGFYAINLYFPASCVISDCNLTGGTYKGVNANNTTVSSSLVRTQIHDFGSTGINLLSSSPVMIGNFVYDNSSYGIYMTNNSDPELIHDYDPGNNVVAYNGGNGVYISSNCDPLLGGLTDDDENIANSFYDNSTYDLNYNGTTQLDATYNWWGTNNSQNFNVYGNVDTGNYLNSDPNDDPHNLSKSTTDMSAHEESGDTMEGADEAAQELFLKARALHRAKQYEDAIVLYRQLVYQYSETKEAEMALVRMDRCYRYIDNKSDSKVELAQIESQYSDSDLGLAASDLLGRHEIENGNIEKAITHYETIVKAKRSRLQQALYALWAIHFNITNDKEQSFSLLKEYESLYGVDENTVFMKLAMGLITGEEAAQFAKERADQERRLGKEANSQEIIELPKQFALYENYPNPFNPETTITFSVPEDNADVRLEIYNMLGQKVAALLDGRMAQGVHTITWDGKNSHGEKVSAGIYVCRMTAKDYNKTIKMTFLP